MSKYGLQLRGAKTLAKPAVAKSVPAVFNDDDDDDNVEREIARQAAKQRSIREAEKQQKQALEQDPSAFDYDGVYDSMKSSQARPAQRAVKRESKYIPHLIEKAKLREREHDIIYEKQLAKERAKEDHLYGDKEKFVTSAYKKKLAEQEKWLAEERMRELKETVEEVTKRDDLSDFYRNLSRNVAFGGGGSHRNAESSQRADRAESQDQRSASENASPNNTTEAADQTPGNKEEPVSKDTDKEELQTQEPSVEGQEQQEQQQQQESAEESRKRKEEEARQRYLARKKLKPVA
ncbi:nuclear speckle splicing regulatory protein 1-like [Selaginella moellendorffii]|uniref:nuclear speckle splicing regulatory protein 1-like n=1 Tax=Selaginella moellendorffii TaxID=88036 RepID=UPI000D1C70DA|nr:nuclear speckle splicing regulatory protein 1-like [Selaginella moellendorffii]|eukprot:XP_024543099.1 nuclear speckle splicing regulatory protein 1-like [Selaginella moellendorffii]